MSLKCVCVLMLNVWTDWIAAVVGDNRSARCMVCDIVLPAHHAGLTKHSQNSQHLQRLSSLNLRTKKTSETNVSFTNRKLQVTIFVPLVAYGIGSGSIMSVHTCMNMDVLAEAYSGRLSIKFSRHVFVTSC